jgi:hypothetical protein
MMMICGCSVGNWADVAHRYDKVLFLRRLTNEIVEPIKLDGRGQIGDVPTQVFTDYLCYGFPARRPDGLVFITAGASGRDYVLLLRTRIDCNAG